MDHCVVLKYHHMSSDSNNFNYFYQNQLTKIAHLVQIKCVLMSCLEDWGKAGPPGTFLYFILFRTDLCAHVSLDNNFCHNPNQASWYSIYLHRMDGKLIWPEKNFVYHSRRTSLCDTALTMQVRRTEQRCVNSSGWQTCMYRLYVSSAVNHVLPVRNHHCYNDDNDYYNNYGINNDYYYYYNSRSCNTARSYHYNNDNYDSSSSNNSNNNYYYYGLLLLLQCFL